MKKLITVLLSIALILALGGCWTKQKEDIYVLYTNDVHCALDNSLNYANVAGLKDELLNEHKYVTLVDAGDYTQGAALGSLTKGNAIIELMNVAGYDIAGVGNHEFDYQMDGLKKNIELADFAIVSCNIRYSGNGENKLKEIKPYVIEDYDGTKVAYIGVATPESVISSTPSYFMEDDVTVYDFYSDNNYKDLYDVVQKNIDEVKKAGAKFIVLLSHLGTDPTSEINAYSLINNICGVDVILDSHSHSTILSEAVLDKNSKEVVLTSTGAQMANIGELILKIDGTIETMLISETSAVSETALSAIDKKKSEFEQLLNHKIGHTAFDLLITTDGFRTVRCRENTLADLVADGMRTRLNTDVAFINGGSIRNSLMAGDFTYNDILSIMPFQNELAIIETDGQTIIDAIEFGTSHTLSYTNDGGNATGESGGFPQVSGLRYTIDTSKDPDITFAEDGTLVSINSYRVKNVEVLENGEYIPIDKDKKYVVGGTAYMLIEGGDGYTVFKNSRIISNSTGIDFRNFIDFVSEDLGGEIPSEYAQLQGRIIVD